MQVTFLGFLTPPESKPVTLYELSEAADMAPHYQQVVYQTILKDAEVRAHCLLARLHACSLLAKQPAASSEPRAASSAQQ